MEKPILSICPYCEATFYAGHSVEYWNPKTHELYREFICDNCFNIENDRRKSL